MKSFMNNARVSHGSSSVDIGATSGMAFGSRSGRLTVMGRISGILSPSFVCACCPRWVDFYSRDSSTNQCTLSSPIVSSIHVVASSHFSRGLSNPGQFILRCILRIESNPRVRIATWKSPRQQHSAAILPLIPCRSALSGIWRSKVQQMIGSVRRNTIMIFVSFKAENGWM